MEISTEFTNGLGDRVNSPSLIRVGGEVVDDTRGVSSSIIWGRAYGMEMEAGVSEGCDENGEEVDGMGEANLFGCGIVMIGGSILGTVSGVDYFSKSGIRCSDNCGGVGIEDGLIRCSSDMFIGSCV